jgi:Tfp pilus assembly protein PilO
MAFEYKQGFQSYRRYYQRVQPLLDKPRTRQYTTAVFSFLAVSLFALYAIKPTIQTILYLRKEIQEKTEINKQMENKIAALIEAQSTYQSIEPQLPLVASAMPDNPDALNLVRQLRNLASTTDASISSVSLSSVQLTQPEGPKKNSSKLMLQELPANIIVSGGYGQMKAFIDSLVQMRRIIHIDSVTFGPATEDSGAKGSNTLQLVLRIKAYYSGP